MDVGGSYWTSLDGVMVPAEGLLGATRLAPPGSPCGRSTSLRDVVEPGLFYVGGSTDDQYGDRLLSTIFLLNGAG
jgi:hypothetical protein